MEFFCNRAFIGVQPAQDLDRLLWETNKSFFIVEPGSLTCIIEPVAVGFISIIALVRIY